MWKWVAAVLAISLPCGGSAHDLYADATPLAPADVENVLSRLEVLDVTGLVSTPDETEPYDMMREIVVLVGQDDEHVSRAIFMYAAIRAGDIDVDGQYAPDADFLIWDDLVSLNDFAAVNGAYAAFDDWFTRLASGDAE